MKPMTSKASCDLVAVTPSIPFLLLSSTHYSLTFLEHSGNILTSRSSYLLALLPRRISLHHHTVMHSFSLTTPRRPSWQPNLSLSSPSIHLPLSSLPPPFGHLVCILLIYLMLSPPLDCTSKITGMLVCFVHAMFCVPGREPGMS